jgi:glutathione synthase/RimK-type ligase-like ATP-grasp enzyme
VRWCEITPARVVNRVYPSSSNASKVFQSHLIREAGFEVPDTLLTDDPDEVRAFLAEHGDLIFKSASGARSVVTHLDADRLARLERVAHCPTVFQELLVGTNVRVHVVGDEVFATRVETAALDYRYAMVQTGVPAELSAIELPAELAARCVELSRRLDLAFAGIDLMFASDGSTYCFEVNPCPGYSYYELSTGQPISAALARYLADQAGWKSSPQVLPSSMSE